MRQVFIHGSALQMKCSFALWTFSVAKHIAQKCFVAPRRDYERLHSNKSHEIRLHDREHMLLIESSARSSTQDVLREEKKEEKKTWQGSESDIGRKCDIFLGLEQVHQEQAATPSCVFYVFYFFPFLSQSVKTSRIFLHRSPGRSDSSEWIRFISSICLNAFSGSARACIPSLFSQPDYSSPLSHARKPGLEKWAEHLHLMNQVDSWWVKWVLE